MADDEGESVMNEVFAVAWEIARGGTAGPPTLRRTSSRLADATDDGFWQHVRQLAEQCRTDDDWQRLLGVLLQISLDPRLDKRPIYQFSVGLNPGALHGLRAARPKRRRGAGGVDAAGEPLDQGTGSKAASARRYASILDRKTKRKRLREILDGAPESSKGEAFRLSRWVLDDAEGIEGRLADERETLAGEIQYAMRKLLGVARHYKIECERLQRELDKALEPEADLGMEFGDEQDVLRAAAGGGGDEAGGAGGEGAAAEPAMVAGGGEGGAAGKKGKAVSSAAGKKAEKAALLKAVDEAAMAVDLERLSELVERSDFEEVAMKAALAIADLCARDEALQQRLADAGGLPRIVSLLDEDFSPRSQLDLALVLKALTANRMHHPTLLAQLVQSGGPRRLVKMVSISPPDERTQAALQIVRSLADPPGPRAALLKESLLPTLLRMLRPSLAENIIEPAAMSISVLARKETTVCRTLVDTQGVPALVQTLGRGGGSLAAHAAAATLGCLAEHVDTGVEAQKKATDAGALEALLPLLDGALGGQPTQAVAAEAAAHALALLCSGSSSVATQLRVLGGLGTLTGLLNARNASAGMVMAACEALGAAASADVTSCTELSRIGAVPLLAHLVKGGTQKVHDAAQAVLELLKGRGDPAVQDAVAGSLRDETEGAQGLVSQLTQGNKLARRAALMLDHMVQASPEVAESVVKMGAVPRLVRMARGGASDVGTLNALGAIEALAQGCSGVQDEAREAGVFMLLPPLIRGEEGKVGLSERAPPPAARVDTEGEGEEGADAEAKAAAPPSSEEVRSNAALCLAALCQGNAINRERAKKAGAAEALATLLDGHTADAQPPYLCAMGLFALGYTDLTQQENVLGLKHEAPKAARRAAKDAEKSGVGPSPAATLSGVWALKAEPEKWTKLMSG